MQCTDLHVNMTNLCTVVVDPVLEVEDSLFHHPLETAPVSLRFSKTSRKMHHLMRPVEERDLHQLI